MTQPIAEVSGLVVKYGERTVLDDISTRFLPSAIRVILGTSGCGKTTLLKSMIGLIRPAAGMIKIFDTPIRDLDENATMDVLRRVGVLFQNGALLGSLTVAENIALPLEMHTALPRSIIDEIVRIKLGQVGLSHALNHYPLELSGGMRKRAALARALALEPPLVFCDEPSAGLDPVTSAGLDDLLLHLRDTLGITIIVVTHELASIDRISDSILFLHQGRVLFDGPLDEGRRTGPGPIDDFFSRRSAQNGNKERAEITLTSGTEP